MTCFSLELRMLVCRSTTWKGCYANFLKSLSLPRITVVEQLAATGDIFDWIN